MEKDIAIFIPTYNAARTLPTVIDRIPEEIKARVKEIFVIDNASPDNTYLIGIGYREESGLSNLHIIRNESNRGYGGSQKRAYCYAIDKGYDIVVMLHGDAQYAPEMLPDLLKPVERGETDLVFGSRMRGDPLNGGMPIYRFIGNKVLTAIENYVLGVDLSEFHSGYRVFNCHALKKIPFELCSNDYHFDTDILIQFKVHGLRIDEVPIPTHYGEESNSPTFLQVISYSLNILRSLFEYSLHKRGLKHIQRFDLQE